ncbi:ArsR/SmtB family transcription factor [Streptomyces sp. NPDC021212]|uniref:ArsR/SmtB family transcription factor n=1 Tax=Streptomyces sp. NPDC021212 TaxID=3365118 RepID=UPI0037BBC6B9
MLRIHFGVEDLARITLAPGADPMWETLLSLYRLRHRQGTVVFGQWKQRLRLDMGPEVRLLSTLAPPVGYAVDFLTPAGAGQSLPEGLEALRRTPRARLRGDLEELGVRHPGRPLPGWARELAQGTPESVDRVAKAVGGYFGTALDPVWHRIQSQVARDRAARLRTLAEGGWETVLATLHPSARWSYPVLELTFPANHDIHLGGRGLTLQPSFFCWGAPTTFLDIGLPPTLVYPVERDLDWAAPRGTPGRHALAALLGATRARVLEAVAVGACSTTELAQRARVPLPTASQQASVLWEAGLVRSQRHRNAIIHMVTPLGAALLDGGPVKT